ncbi:hypothetical protein HZA99_03270 [Candidatus Woesearchaeota archaeon]|nr:hypothetical protein [Candidatus Woesearchaeota archaeon]
MTIVEPIDIIPSIIASITLAYASFTRKTKIVIIAFIVWFLIFVLLLNRINFFG